MNITPEYKKYIEDSRAAGLTNQQMRIALIEGGWTDAQVDDLFSSYSSENASSARSDLDQNSQSTPAASFDFGTSPSESKPSSASLSTRAAQSTSEAVEEKTSLHHAQNENHEIARRQDFSPQLEPQELRPHLSQFSHEKEATKESLSHQQESDKMHQENDKAQRTQPATEARTGIAAYQVGSQLNSDFQKQDTHTSKTEQLTPKEIDQNIPPAHASPSASSASIGAVPFQQSVTQQNTQTNYSPHVDKNPVTNMMPQGQAAAASGTVASNQKNKRTTSIVKKIFVTFLVVAFLAGSAGYAYMQFVNPFILSSDEDLLSSASDNLLAQINNVESQTTFELYKGDTLALSTEFNLMQKTDGEELKSFEVKFDNFVLNPDSGLFTTSENTVQSLEVSDENVDVIIDTNMATSDENDSTSLNTINTEDETVVVPETQPLMSFMELVRLGMVEGVDMQLAYVNDIFYMYPGTLIRSLPLDENTIAGLFETWIVFNTNSNNTVLTNFLGTEVSIENIWNVITEFSISDLQEYSLTSVVEDKDKKITISITPEEVSNIIASSVSDDFMNMYENYFQQQVDIEIVITPQKEIQSLAITFFNEEEDIRGVIRTDINFLDQETAPVMRPERTITIEELREVIAEESSSIPLMESSELENESVVSVEN